MEKKSIKNNSQYLLLLIITLVAFKIIYGLNILIPTNTAWMLNAYHDWGQHYLGWATFRDEPWTFPIGDMKNYNYPAGSNIGFTDSIPLLAIIFKIFSSILPENFQYFGLWFFLCHFLLGFFTIKILKLYKVKYIYIYLAVIFIITNPVLLYRGMHPALCAQWFLLASLYNYLKKPTIDNVNKINRNQIILLALSSLVNPYLFLMTIGFNIIVPFKNYYYDKVISLKKAFLFFIYAIGLVVFSWLIVGMVRFDNSALEVVNSYGLYSFNLNSFFNAHGFSKFTPQLSLFNEKQYEGYAYLGIGEMILLFITLFYCLISIIIFKVNFLKSRRFIPLYFLTFLLVLFAVTNIITFGDKVILNIELPHILIKLGNVFRASGRFIWLFYYLLFLFAIYVFIKIRLREYIKIPVLFFIVLIQVYDISPIMFREFQGGAYVSKKINQEKWIKITSKFNRIITYPPFENHLLSPMDYQDLCFVAQKNKMPITCGYVARDIGLINNKFKDTLNLNISESYLLSENDLYITTSKYVNEFIPLLYNKKLHVRYFDGYYFLFTNKHKIELPILVEEQVKINLVYNELQNAINNEKITKPIFDEDKIKFSIEKNYLTENLFQINGWAYIEGTKDNKNDSIYIIISNNKNSFRIKTKSIIRKDVTSAINKGILDNSGFNATFFTDKIGNGFYDVIIAIQTNKKWHYKKLDQQLELVKTNPPKLILSLPKASSNKKTIGNLEDVTAYNGSLYINGWAGFENEDSKNTNIKIAISNNRNIYELETQKVIRKDVTSYYKNKYNYDQTGYKSKNKLGFFPKGKYKIAVIVTKPNNQINYFNSDKEISIK